EAVHAGDSAAGITLLEAGERSGYVCGLRGGLARDVVPLTERSQDLREPPLLAPEELEDEEGGDHPVVRVPVLAEIEVPGDLASEHRVLVAHPLLDEGMAHAVHEGSAPGAGDAVRHRPRRPDVVDDLRTRRLAAEELAEESGDEVAGHEGTRVVHEEAAVGVAVPGDPEVGLLRGHTRHDLAPVRLLERIRGMVRERAVEVEV